MQMNAVAKTSVDAEKNPTLTDKAIRANQQAMEVIAKLCAIQRRVTAPVPEGPISGNPPPPCDHALFAIESIQQYLDEALNVADKILATL